MRHILAPPINPLVFFCISFSGERLRTGGAGELRRRSDPVAEIEPPKPKRNKAADRRRPAPPLVRLVWLRRDELYQFSSAGPELEGPIIYPSHLLDQRLDSLPRFLALGVLPACHFSPVCIGDYHISVIIASRSKG